MIQSIYTSVSNADSVNCGKKGSTIKSDPIPLLRNNYLGEYRTELEKAKVRKNLGIADEQSLLWGSISGFIENQEDLIKYIQQLQSYKTELSEDIETVNQALDYVIRYVTTFQSEKETLIRLDNEIKDLVNTLSNTKTQLQQDIDINKNNIQSLEQTISDNVFSLEQAIVSINQSIEQLNQDLQVINVDANILSWIQQSTSSSNTIKLENEQTLELKVSSSDKNAINFIEGLYVRDYSEEIEKISTLEQDIKNNSEAIQELEILDVYQTELSDDTTAPITLGGIPEGTSVATLKGKTITEILDTLIFPTTIKPLVYPRAVYTTLPKLVKVGSSLLYPQLLFSAGDSGGEIERVEVVLNPNNIEVTGTYETIGTYTYQGTVYYSEGEYLMNNKGELTNIRVEAGSVSDTITIIATYPWYTSEVGKPNTEQQLVAFGQSTELEFSLVGNAIIKLPGLNSQILEFMMDAGLGYLSVDIDGWEESQESINGITYKVWTKKDSYPAITKHKIKFKLAL